MKKSLVLLLTAVALITVNACDDDSSSSSSGGGAWGTLIDPGTGEGIGGAVMWTMCPQGSECPNFEFQNNAQNADFRAGHFNDCPDPDPQAVEDSGFPLGGVGVYHAVCTDEDGPIDDGLEIGAYHNLLCAPGVTADIVIVQTAEMYPGDFVPLLLFCNSLNTIPFLF